MCARASQRQHGGCLWVSWEPPPCSLSTVVVVGVRQPAVGSSGYCRRRGRTSRSIFTSCPVAHPCPFPWCHSLPVPLSPFGLLLFVLDLSVFFSLHFCFFNHSLLFSTISVSLFQLTMFMTLCYSYHMFLSIVMSVFPRSRLKKAIIYLSLRGQKCLQTSPWSGQGATIPSHLEENWIGTWTCRDQAAVQSTAAWPRAGDGLFFCSGLLTSVYLCLLYHDDFMLSIRDVWWCGWTCFPSPLDHQGPHSTSRHARQRSRTSTQMNESRSID